MLTTHPTLEAAAERFARRAEEYFGRVDAADDFLGDELHEILQRIAGEPEVRFFLDGTRNLGHQASTLALVKRLIELTGYRGHVRIVYADYENPYLGRTAEKLALLWQGLDPERIDTTELPLPSGGRITFLPYARRDELTERAAFGFTGGADDMSINYARELNVDYFCRVQPYLWDDDPTRKADPYYESSRIETHDSRFLYLVDAWPNFKTLVVKPPDDSAGTIAESTWRWFGEEQNYDPQLKIRCRNAGSLYTALAARPECRLWPAYGLHHFHERSPEVLLNWVLAACPVQLEASGPLVLASFTPEVELTAGHRLIAALAEDVAGKKVELEAFRTAYGEMQRADGAEGDSKDVVDARANAVLAFIGAWKAAGGRLNVVPGIRPGGAEYHDAAAEISEAIAAAGPHDVVLVGLGTQPPEVFNHFFERAELPGIIEGQATCGRLLARGKPFLHLVREEHSFEHGYPNGFPGWEDRSIAHWLQRYNRWLRDFRTTHQLPKGALGDPPEFFLYMELQPRYGGRRWREVDEYFRRIGRYCRQEIHDKFLMALVALWEVLGAEA